MRPLGEPGKCVAALYLCSASKCHDGQEEKSGIKDILEQNLSWTLTLLHIGSQESVRLPGRRLKVHLTNPDLAQILKGGLQWGSHEDRQAPQVPNNKRKAQVGLESWLSTLRAPRFNSRHPCGGSLPFVSSSSKDSSTLFCTPWTPDKAHLHACSQMLRHKNRKEQ